MLSYAYLKQASKIKLMKLVQVLELIRVSGSDCHLMKEHLGLRGSVCRLHNNKTCHVTMLSNNQAGTYLRFVKTV